VACLARALILAGLGMTCCGGSFSTSQGEHLISHYLELRGSAGGLHGEQIGVTTITMARLQERLLAQQALEVFPCTMGEPDFLERYGPELGPECWREFALKRLDEAGAAALNRRLREDWLEIRKRIAEVAMSPERIRRTLARLGAPTEPGQLGWSPEAYGEAVRHAAELRNRYTFLDLARDCRLPEPWTA
jgi:glycerol-1-phosphate dehydrogenase [NAD(P)+]